MQQDPHEQRQTLNAMRALLTRACRTIAAMRDPEARYFGYAKLPANFVRDVQEAYGYGSAKIRFVPSARDLSELDVTGAWLAFVRREEGQRSISRLFGLALGLSTQRLADREDCSKQTILNRIDRSCAAVLEHFGEQCIEIDTVDEPAERPVRHVVTERPVSGRAGNFVMGKVWVSTTRGGDGRFMRNGREVRDGSEKIERLKIPA